jgi:hypothetical protein
MIRIPVVVILLIFLSACDTNTGGHSPEKTTVAKEDCAVRINDFIYPDMLNIDSKKHICTYKITTGRVTDFRQLFNSVYKENGTDPDAGSIFSALPEGDDRINISFSRVKKEKGNLVKFALICRFYDANFALISYGAKTKILYDVRNDMILCFKREADYPGYSAASITRIYMLDKGLMPVYSIDKQDTGFVCRKYFYDNKFAELYSRLYDLSATKPGSFNQLNYNSVIRYLQRFPRKKYRSQTTQKRISLPNSKQFPYGRKTDNEIA